MSLLLGIDVGTSGCKVALFSPQGELLASAFREYRIQRSHSGWAELDATAVWEIVKNNIRVVVAGKPNTSIMALAISSMGEAVVPVTADRQILGPSLLNFDVRGSEYLNRLGYALDNDTLYQINGNTLGNHFSLTKLMWIKDHQPELYERTDKFLHWGAFIAFMLGAQPAVDYSLANRTLLFDMNQSAWSQTLMDWSGLDQDKLPATVPSCTVIGSVSKKVADELGLLPGTPIIAGAHDQCANAVGCGVIIPGSAAVSMGTYICITPAFTERLAPGIMIARGLNTEHHAVPGQYVSFIYNHAGSLVRWFRDTFAATEHHMAQAAQEDIYPKLFAEFRTEPSSVLVLPHFAQTGPPAFIADSCGVIAGLKLETTRGDILKGIVEGTTFYLKEIIDSLGPTGIHIVDYRPVGGGSQSDIWIQTCADILGKPFTRPVITEAGALGASIIAGVGSGVFSSLDDGVKAMVKLDRTFEPDKGQHAEYSRRYEKYQKMWPLLKGFLRELASDV